MADLVRVATVPDELAAETAVGLLRVEGVAAIWRPAASALAGSPLGSVGGIAGPCDVLVHPQNEERARELLTASDDSLD